MIILHEKKHCVCKQVEWAEAKEFLNKYHKQGAGKPTNLNYALYTIDKNEIIGIATFAPSRFKYQKITVDYEWMRLCYKEDVFVKGGTQKLLKMFTEQYGGSIVSYQFDTFKGDMFEGLGFKLLSKRKSDIYVNPTTGKETRHRFINDKNDKKLQQYLLENPDKNVADYFGYTEVKKDAICYTWYREATPIGYIYKITSPEGKIYIGLKKSSVFVESYWSSSQNNEYWQDLNKFGKEAFKREIIEWCYTLDELTQREIYWIKKCKSTVEEGGYNICIAFPQIIQTPEVKRKLKDASEKYWSNPINRIERGLKVKNSELYKASAATRGKKISEGLKTLTEEEKEIKYAFTKTEEYREKVRQNSRGKHFYNNGEITVFTYECPGEGWVKGMLIHNPKTTLTEEHKTKLREVQTGKRWWTNGIKNKRSAECPGEGWVQKRKVSRKTKYSWWNNGITQIQAAECPGKEWIKGRLNKWEPSCTPEEFYELCIHFSYGKLAKLFNTSVPVIRSYCKRHNINKKETEILRRNKSTK